MQPHSGRPHSGRRKGELSPAAIAHPDCPWSPQIPFPPSSPKINNLQHNGFSNTKTSPTPLPSALHRARNPLPQNNPRPRQMVHPSHLNSRRKLRPRTSRPALPTPLQPTRLLDLGITKIPHPASPRSTNKICPNRRRVQTHRSHPLNQQSRTGRRQRLQLHPLRVAMRRSQPRAGHGVDAEAVFAEYERDVGPVCGA